MQSLKQIYLGLVCLLLGSQAGAGQDSLPTVLLPQTQLTPAQVAIIVNTDDPLSIQIGDYYSQARGVPAEQIIRVSFSPDNPVLNPQRFLALREQVENQTPEQVQAYVLTWASPYRVGCMSITTAFAVGFHRAWCSSERCAPTQVSPYFNHPVTAPAQRYRLRPTMSLAALNFDQAKALIDRGIAADNSWPEGSAYLLRTTDRARSVRAASFPEIVGTFESRLNIETLEQDSLLNRDDVLFYETGLTHIDGLDTLHFLPGAVADHLTSAGGRLTGSGQMSALRWLEAGATGSYGAVVEPCNLPGKFPHYGVLMQFYLHGRTLLESYWASVQMPGEGIFIGEPLSKPFAGYRLAREGRFYRLTTYSLPPGRYQVQTAPYPFGPYSTTGFVLTARPGQSVFTLPVINHDYLRLEPVSAP